MTDKQKQVLILVGQQGSIPAESLAFFFDAVTPNLKAWACKKVTPLIEMGFVQKEATPAGRLFFSLTELGDDRYARILSGQGA